MITVTTGALYALNLFVWWGLGGLTGFLVALGLVAIDAGIELTRQYFERDEFYWYDLGILVVTAQAGVGIILLALEHLA